jgi:hypothetical protein
VDSEVSHETEYQLTGVDSAAAHENTYRTV